MQITAAGNTEVPAYLVLIAKGYEIIHRDPDDAWVAQKGEDAFGASGPLELLGLAAMAEARGNNWRATDEEIDAFLEKYPGT
jgi:hypothetical protein